MTKEEALDATGRYVYVPEATAKKLVDGGIMLPCDAVEGAVFLVKEVKPHSEDNSRVWLYVSFLHRDWWTDAARLELAPLRESLTASDFDS